MGINKVINVLDDFLFVAPSYHECKETLDVFKNLAAEIGISLAKEKTIGPVINLVFLGILLDTINMTAYLSKAKIDSYAQNLTKILSNPKITLRELKSVIGKLQFATSVIRLGQPFLRRLIKKQSGYKNLTVTSVFPLKSSKI